MNYKSLLFHALAVLFFLIITFTYFSPMLSGETISQMDVKNWQGMSKEVIDYRESHDGENALWTNSMFGGMPSYLISVDFPNKINDFFADILNLGNKKPASHLFLYLIGFYITLLIFGVSQRVSLIGAFAYAFSTYFLIIIEAGHVTKAIAIGYMPLVIASCYLALNKRPVLGSILLALFLSFQLGTRHYQITYYTMIVVLFYGLFKLIEVVKNKEYLKFVKSVSLLIVGALIALAIDFPNFYLINEYGAYSMRGQSELSSDHEIKTTGLDKDYITSWSYGKAETWTFLIPNFTGGGASDDYQYSDFYKEWAPRYKQYFMQQGYSSQQASEITNQQISGSFYWGDQPFTSGPVYIGASIIFLFILGLFVLKGWLKWWLVAVTIISIFLGWGRHMMWFSDLWLDFVPGYNKFRTVSMILVIAEFSIPLIAILGLDKFLNGEFNSDSELKPWQRKLQISKNPVYDVVFKSLFITGGITMFFALFGSALFSFGSEKFEQMNEMTTAIVDARIAVFKADAWRSVLFIILTASVLFIYATGKLKKNYAIFILGAIILMDLIPVNKRYLNNDDFEKPRRASVVYPKTPADEYILSHNESKARVLFFPEFNVQRISTPFNDASVSYFHQSIGGYHGAKMKRYQELIDSTIHYEMAMLAQNYKNGVDVSIIFPHLPVLNMLNTRWFISDKNKTPFENPYALGNAWFVDEVQIVENADAELHALKKLPVAKSAVVDKRFANQVQDWANTVGKKGQIVRKSYSPDKLVYECEVEGDKIAIFSEIYYDKGWNATIDGKPADYFRANYVLRGMKIPAGKHEIIFTFEPQGYSTGIIITLISSLILLLSIIGYTVNVIVRKEKAFV